MQTKTVRRLVKLGTLTAGLAPAGLIAVRFGSDRLGANPIATAMNQLGFWALILLLASLACTPVHLLGWKSPLAVRKTLGLLAFLYACLHLGVYLALDQFFDWTAIFEDIVKRKFITVGFAAFALLVPLAVTSTGRMVKRLGFPRWKRLHRLVYASAALGVVHFVWRVKSDYVEPAICGGVLFLLIAVRVVAHLQRRGRRSDASSASA